MASERGRLSKDAASVRPPRSLDLEINKVRQYAELTCVGVATPRTVAVVGNDRLIEAARRAFGGGPFMLKPNRGGKGLGVRLLENADIGPTGAAVTEKLIAAMAAGRSLLGAAEGT